MPCETKERCLNLQTGTALANHKALTRFRKCHNSFGFHKYLSAFDKSADQSPRPALPAEKVVAESFIQFKRALLWNDNNYWRDLCHLSLLNRKFNLSDTNVFSPAHFGLQCNSLIMRQHRTLKCGRHFYQSRSTAKADVPGPNSRRLPCRFDQQRAGKDGIQWKMHGKNPVTWNVHFTNDLVPPDFTNTVNLKHLLNREE